jgi:hypothetical protein
MSRRKNDASDDDDDERVCPICHRYDCRGGPECDGDWSDLENLLDAHDRETA